jgi:hypothetical protein
VVHQNIYSDIQSAESVIYNGDRSNLPRQVEDENFENNISGVSG